MICPNCGVEIQSGQIFCQKCGCNVSNEPNQYNAQYNYPVNNIPQNYYQPNNQAEKTDIVTIGQYIGWELLGFIPIVGFILFIVFACDSSKKNRSNFFKAKLILMAIGALLSILLGILIGILGLAGMDILEDFYYGIM